MFWQVLLKRKWLGFILIILIAMSLSWWGITSLRIQQEKANQLVSENLEFVLSLSELSRSLEDYNKQTLPIFLELQDIGGKERARKDFIEKLSLFEEKNLVEDEVVNEIEHNFSNYTTVVENIIKREDQLEDEFGHIIDLNIELRESIQQLYVAEEAQQEFVQEELDSSFNDSVTSMILFSVVLTALALLYLGIIPTLFE